MNRNIDKVICVCGGDVGKVDTTEEEESAHGCGHKGCCVHAYQCEKCSARFTFVLDAPDW